MKSYPLRLACLFISALTLLPLGAQLPEECKLAFGTNLAGMADFGTELPFVDLMHNAREWYTKDVGNPNAAFNSEQAANLSYRPDGYPTHAPQTVAGHPWPQEIVTIWGRTAGWPSGEYTVLWDGTGDLRILGSLSNLNQTSPNRAIFDLVPQPEGIVEITIETSDINDPVRNIRLIMPGHEATYADEPFNPIWLDKLLTFDRVRFMDWGQTNDWGQDQGEGWQVPDEFDWDERARMDHYTWAYEKGIPYEMMVKLLNDYDLDGWICVPHRASPDYLANMAAFFRDNLEPERHLHVEYSNEIWNWIFGQAQWLNYYGCEQTGTSWPEGTVPYIQRCLDAFTTAYAGQLDRITRVVGTQLSWVDVSQRIANNLTPGSFDAITPTWYFGLTEDGDAVLDGLGPAATAADVITYARAGMEVGFQYILDQKNEVADPLGLPLVFYEGGQHLTPLPFGFMPTYDQALLDVQRDPGMYDLYQEWMDSLRQLQSGDDPLLLMHFSFVAPRTAQFGSWGMLETMDQDTNLIPAPKYSALLANLPPPACAAVLSVEWEDSSVRSDGCNALITWSTRAEADASHFTVQRSRDGINFRSVGRVEATNAPTGSRYAFNDRGLEAGDYYYRIEQQDFDGGVDFFELNRLVVDCDGTPDQAIQLFPNPATNELFVVTDATQCTQLEVYASDGRRVWENGGPPAGTQRVPLANWPAGVYFLTLRYVDGRMPLRRKFVKR